MAGKATMKISIELINACGMRCPTCPRGRRQIKNDADQRCTQQQLRDLLEKVRTQTPITWIALYRWSDPLLHPELPELGRIAANFGPVCISTTGNHQKCDVPELSTVPWSKFVVPFSGWTQETYGATHAGGEVERSKAFVERIASLGLRNREVTFHRYKHNIHEEGAVKRFARQTGCKFTPIWATHLGVEPNLAGASEPHVIFTPEEAQHLYQRSHECFMQTTCLDLWPNGNVITCAASSGGAVANLFEQPLAKVMEAKRTAELCTACMAKGIHSYVCCFSVKVDKFAAQRMGVDGWRMRYERMRKRLWLIRGGYSA
jgi:hypothetical protein